MLTREYVKHEKRVAKLTEAMERLGFKLASIYEQGHKVGVRYNWEGRKEPYGDHTACSYSVSARLYLNPSDPRKPSIPGDSEVKMSADVYTTRGIDMLARARTTIAEKLSLAARAIRDWKRADAKTREGAA